MNRRKTLYLAGPMRHKPYLNFLQFDVHKAALEIAGYKVLSPADLDRAHGFDPFKSLTKNLPTPEECAERDVAAVIKSDAVVLMKGWRKSKGSLMEVAVANFLDKPIFELKRL